MSAKENLYRLNGIAAAMMHVILTKEGYRGQGAARFSQ